LLPVFVPPDFFAPPDFEPPAPEPPDFAPPDFAPPDFAPPDFAPPDFVPPWPPDDLPAAPLPPPPLPEPVAELAVRLMPLLTDFAERDVARPSRSAALPARSVALPACRAMLLTALDVDVLPLRPVDERADDLPDFRLPPGRTMSPSVGLTLPTVSAKVSSSELPRFDPRSATSPATSVAWLTIPVPASIAPPVMSLSFAAFPPLLDCLRLLGMIFSPPVCRVE
jgi:hypothetical protein